MDNVVVAMPCETYELIFYDLDGEIDSIQQYRNEKKAREVLQLFDEPASKEIYSKISLVKIEWDKQVRQYWLDSLEI